MAKQKAKQTSPAPNRNRQEYLKQLDDRRFAQDEYDKFLLRAKALLNDVAFVYENAQEAGLFPAMMAELLDMFMIRHENFERSQFAEDLKLYLFYHWTRESGDAFHAWERKAFTGTDFEFELEETKPEQPQTASDDLAELLSKVVNHPDIPDTLYHKITGLTISYGDIKDTTPEFLRSALTNLSDEQRHYEKPLDLSEVSTEHLQTDDCDEIAEQLSKVLNNPKLPAELYNAIHHGLDEIGNNASPSALTRLENKPEYIKEFLRDAMLDCSEMPSEHA